MKKILYVLLFTMMLLGFAACSKSSIVSQTVDKKNVENLSPATKPTKNEKGELEIFEVHPEETGESVSQPVSYSIYVPNDNADGFDTETVSTEAISAETVLSELKKRNVLPDAVSMNRFEIDNGLIAMDLNQAFADVVCSMGTSGELMIVGSVVNTFLDAFHAEYVYFTVDDQVLESGHTIYEFAIPFVSID